MGASCGGDREGSEAEYHLVGLEPLHAYSLLDVREVNGARYDNLKKNFLLQSNLKHFVQAGQMSEPVGSFFVERGLVGTFQSLDAGTIGRFVAGRISRRYILVAVRRFLSVIFRNFFYLRKLFR